MEEAAAVRRAVAETVRDVVPEPLQDRIVGFVDDGSMVPGTVTVLAAESFGGEEVAVDPLLERAVGVQLIYDGLRLTRDLVHDEPWDRGEKPDADMGILAADVMVARGFYLLARSEAAECAVEVVRAFGRDQTAFRAGGDTSLDSRLESDVLELAVLAGATAVGVTVSDADLAGFANGQVDGVGYPPVDGTVAGGLRADLRALADGHVGERAARSD
ncbi:hypothetical protein N0B31_10595 [Salinirubellus salinus]|uniref:Uncharacterized protein n=1 Tax=Salinirubellus salinus TaxID=1364945 RepID=A0A9E7R932_9EURY|nr:hypothetical protein [Salinirubellus salinus]UWM56723.1 hypothetical protein N0B31_10595 [Salinirubellus salinus]